MRDAAGTFMVEMLRKFIKLALQARRHRSTRPDLCSRVISEMLVGNVLLSALQEAQKASSKKDATALEEGVAGSGQEAPSSLLGHPAGLLSSLPASILSQAPLFADVENATNFFLLLEEYLSSKEMPYAAAGLTALLSVLKHFPQLCTSSEIQRFGMVDL